MATGLSARLRRARPGFDLAVEAQLAPGEIVALLGPSGAGKTTLLRCLAGLETALDGTVRWDDEVWNAPGAPALSVQQRRVGFVFASAVLFTHLTARANVAFGAVDDQAVDGWLERFELGSLASHYPRQLSAGQQQRVALARALASAPRLLLLDEPFASLDPALKLRLYEDFKRVLEETGVAAIIVTHELAEATWLADTLWLLADGRLVQAGPVHEVLAAPATAEAARLLGHVNVLPGSLSEGRLCWGTLQLTLADAARGPGAVAWSIRPEAIAVLDSPSDLVNRVTGTIRAAAPWGDRWRLLVEVEGAGELDVRPDSVGQDPSRWVPGIAVSLRLPPEALTVYAT